MTSADVRLAHQEGFVSVEHMKRYTTLGMATDQGKMGNIIGLALMAEALGKDIPEVGTTRFRPPYTPVAIGALAGRNVQSHFKPLRRTPLHDWNLQEGAEMTDAGLWHRPWYFARPGETITEAYMREATTVRETVGDLRRQFAGQDRGAGAGRGRVSEPHLCQWVRQAGGR